MAEEKTTTGSDAAAAVRAKRAGAPRPRSQGEPAPAPESQPQRSQQLEVTGDAPSPAHTLTGTFVAGHTISSDYVSAKADGYYSWYPEGCLQPSCRMLWNAGQMVLRSYYDSYGGDDVPSRPGDAQPVNAPGGGLAPHVSGVTARA